MSPRAYIQHHTLPNGNLILTAANAARHDIARQLNREKRSWDHVWFEVIVGPYQEAGILYNVEPEWIGALTSAPILADDYICTDNGDHIIPDDASVWWFPDYMIRDPLEELTRHGRVEFTLAS